MELECAVQQYAWGVKGSKSSVAQLSAASNSSFSIDEEKPYAELWMGTHPNGPALIKGSKKTLKEFIEGQVDILGKSVLDKFGNELPFLFKVLSVNQALSIQAHPNKKHAEVLHKERPDVYKDPNHKPEMALALTPFQALCGFRPKEEIAKFFKDIPELTNVIGSDKTKTFIESPNESSLKECFSSLMNADKDIVASNLKELEARLPTLEEKDASSLLKDLFLTLHKQYPGDGGCFSIYLLNYLTLMPGEAMFLGPNIIHAYLLGSCMECMACSDNVVRAGLTPKYQDVETLVKMLEYEMGDANSRKFDGKVIDECTTLFNPPVPDFAVEMIKVPSSKSYEIGVRDSASIVIFVEGACSVTVTPSEPESNLGSKLSKGSIVFLKADQTLSLTPDKSEIIAYRALCVL